MDSEEEAFAEKQVVRGRDRHVVRVFFTFDFEMSDSYVFMLLEVMDRKGN